MPLRFKERILRRLKSVEQSRLDAGRLAAELDIPEEDLEDFELAIQQLADAGEVVLGDNRSVSLPPLGEEMVGEFRKNPRGFGFVIPKNPHAHGDLFIPPGETGDALTGDTVRAKVQRRRGRQGESDFTGTIVEIVERKQSHFTGELQKRGGQWLVFPDGKSMTDPIVVRDPGAKNAKEGDKVVVDILNFPEGDYLGEGVITKVLGAAGEPDVETQAVIAAYNLPGEFPDACVEQARDISTAFEEEVEKAEREGAFEWREDLRDTFILTIDPPDARDFDDAISIERKRVDGREVWELGVHIADVGGFIEPGTPLDVEAAQRGNSVYLPRLVIPMLPELLSNGVCSLQEGVPRFCKSAFMRYDGQGKVIGRGYSESVIKSAKRLTYLEAQALIEGDLAEAKKHAKTEPNYTADVREALRNMNALSKIIHKRRHDDGMIHLDLPEVELIFDDSGRVVDAEPEDDAWTHTVIEMFMVEANEAVAVLFERLGLPLLRRIHPDPEPTAFEDLRKFLKAAGVSIPKEPDRKDLQAVLDATKGTPQAPAVHFAVLRTLTKAQYSPAQIGHYALASGAYAHFTSPIRRYPDLTVHRALGEFLHRTDNGAAPPKDLKAQRNLGRELRDTKHCPPEQTLLEIGARCNRTEENATDAERDLRNFLVMQLMAERLGEPFPGVVTGVTPAGVFVRIDKYLVEGLVKTADLPIGGKGGGRWRIDPKTGALAEQNTGRSFRLGDRVQVVVSAVNLAARQMELVIPDEEAAKRAGVGKALKLGAGGGGVGHAEGAGFQAPRTGSQRRSAKSKRRDKAKKDFRKERKDKGKR